MTDKEKRLIIDALESYWEYVMHVSHPDNKEDYILSQKIIKKLKQELQE